MIVFNHRKERFGTMGVSVPIPREAVDGFCRRWDIVELAFFGSVLRKDFGPKSDLDVLLRFHPSARPTLFDMTKMREELTDIFGRDVDLLSRRGVENSRNPFRKKAILESAEVVYGA